MGSWRIGLCAGMVAVASVVAAPGQASAASSAACFPAVAADATAVTTVLASTAAIVEGQLDSALGSNLPIGTTATVQVRLFGVTGRLVETRNADSSVSAEFDLAGVAGSGPVVVWSATASQASDAAAGTSSTSYDGAFDFTALHSAFSLLPATGTMRFDEVRTLDPTKPAPGVKKTGSIVFTNFQPDPSDPRGPRTGSYTHLDEPGVGGKFQFSDSLVLLCPFNPFGLRADTKMVARWFRSQDGGIHGRSDTMASGGQIPDGDSFLAVGCVSTIPTIAVFNLNKEEDASGDTIVSAVSGPPDPCSPAFGPVPAANEKSTDYDFAPEPTFPGEW